MTAQSSQPSSALPDDLSPAAEAYLWGFPFLSLQRTRLLLCSRTDTAKINHVDSLATPNDRAVVLPNNDTLYSSAWYDLRHGDLTINVPPMDHAHRYWNVMLVDAYTHVTYVCRRHHGVAGTRVQVTLDPSKPSRYEHAELVKIGTPTVWVIIRVLVESPEDVSQARRLQQGIQVIAPPAHPKVRTERAGRPTAIAKAGADIFTEIRDFMALDPPAPWHPQLTSAAEAIITTPQNHSAEVLRAGVDEGERLLAKGNSSGTMIENGWSTGKDTSGPGNDILKRALGAKFGLGGHQAVENRSYSAQKDAQGDKLDGNRPLRIRFEADAMPPCSGFWSLTAYGADLYLAENEIYRWSISDRTPGLHDDHDGSLTITFSTARPLNAANWLPVPAGPYLLGMRVYEGDEAVIRCEWFPPPLYQD